MGVPKIEYLNENLTWQLDRNIGEIEIDLVFFSNLQIALSNINLAIRS